jgi:hypothetical protein
MVHSVQDAALLHAIIHGQTPGAVTPLSLKGVRLGVIRALEERILNNWPSGMTPSQP